ncbi:hypothetical protein ATN84_07515 [Paramesorhizobium deserti]|uniref:Peroxisomal trans-2-enoyl-CoA reductase n=1 Tax=Paramesorhizobium deserti TaxID=1494590 RepID=A0A135HVK5_9HYPH|nr:hypothetical protein ATN84_07515 [Paramesorhizobium deserti]
MDYAKQGIRVNTVIPGLIESGMSREAIESGSDLVQKLVAGHPIGRWGESSEIGEAVAWLLSDSASFVTGVALPVDGGYCISK